MFKSFNKIIVLYGHDDMVGDTRIKTAQQVAAPERIKVIG